MSGSDDESRGLPVFVRVVFDLLGRLLGGGAS